MSLAPSALASTSSVPRESSIAAACSCVSACRSMLRPPLASASARSADGSPLAVLAIVNTGTGKDSRHGAP